MASDSIDDNAPEGFLGNAKKQGLDRWKGVTYLNVEKTLYY